MSVDPISAVMPDSLASQLAGGATSVAPTATTTSSVSVFDVNQFRAQMDASKVSETSEPSAPESVNSAAESEMSRGFIAALHKLDTSGGALGDRADNILAKGENVTPSDMIQLTVESHKFMFQCEITANVANRSAEGVQQLFRQQS